MTKFKVNVQSTSDRILGKKTQLTYHVYCECVGWCCSCFDVLALMSSPKKEPNCVPSSKDDVKNAAKDIDDEIFKEEYENYAI